MERVFRSITEASDDVDLTLRRIAVGARLVGVGWLWLLAAVALGNGRMALPSTVVILMAAVAIWGGLTVVAQLRRPAWLRSPLFLAADVALAAATLFGPFWSGVPNTPFYGGYPVTAVVLVASVRGVPAGMGAAVALSAAVIVRLAVVPGTVTDSLSQVIIYVFSALIIGWAVKVLRQSDRLRREALAQLAEERADRARAEERAEVAAHLHDSVLQTLALIQRSPQAGEEVAILARRQERELRQWLYGRRAGERAGVAQTLRAMCAEVEELYRVKVETVTVGDRQLSPALEALVAAGREAVVNAAKHAGVEEVAVYLEAEAERTSLYVRDRGKGFDLERVPGDRSGIAASIRARIARHGGTVEIRSMPERGTEVRLEVEG